MKNGTNGTGRQCSKHTKHIRIRGWHLPHHPLTVPIHSPTNNNTHNSTKQSPEQDPIQQESSASANPTKKKTNTLPGSDSLYLSVQAMVRQHTINLQAVCGKGKGTRSSSTSYYAARKPRLPVKDMRRARATMTIIAPETSTRATVEVWLFCTTTAGRRWPSTSMVLYRYEY
jgi:hypothetical protein